MASPSTPKQRIDDAVGDENKNCDGRPKSQFQKTVCLEDWWLSKAENDSQGSGLAVAGLASREQRAMRVFSSAPIHKRYDVFTLETTDGICVIIKGFINKARTAENGFPSDVFDHFVFGFPPYWKEYAEKCIGGQSHVDSNEREVGCQEKMGAKGLRKSSRTASSTVVLPPQSGSVVSGMDNTIVSSIVPGGLEKKFYSKESTSDDQMTPNIPVNCPDKKSLTTSRLGGNANAIIPAVIGKDVDDPQNYNRGILSACRFINESRATRSSHPRKVKSDRKIPIKSKFDGDMSLPDGNKCHTKSIETTVSLSKLERKHKKDKKSCLKLRGEKARSKSVLSVGSGKIELTSVDREPEGRNDFHSEAVGLKETAEKMNLKELDVFVKENFDLIAETLNQDKDLKTKGSIEKANVRVKRSHNRPAAADNKEHTTANKINSSDNDGTSVMKPRRKLTYESPGSEKERVHSGSALSVSFNRSRSGRLLMPTLEFWRNQRAFYDADGTVTGIEEEIHPEQPTRGSRSTTQRKRRQLL